MHISTLISDIYERVESNKKVSKENLEAFLEGLSDVVVKQLEEKRNTSHEKNIRMSSIGKPDRKIWMELNGPDVKRSYTGGTLIKFLYGSIIEELVIFLAKEAGHSVQELQKQCQLEGIKGHIDCKIDGEVVDIKSASDFAFRKFKTGTIENDDPFGYIGQISAYVEAEGQDTGYLLAMNKVTGELALLELDDFSLINATKRIQHVKKLAKSEEMPDLCYQPQPEGKSGNMKLARDCTYCPYKWTCFPDMRVFRYGDGLRYLTTVEKEPTVQDVTDSMKG
tara:strand:+ start:1336 stop:2175 length:840 start_codon:yes stop_codon:yes gene_type:complete